MGERKVKVEIRIGRDEDGDWWTVLMVDGNEAHGADHTNIGQPPRKQDSTSRQRLTILTMKPSGVSPKEACQLDTETGFVLVAPAVFLTGEGRPGRLRSPVRGPYGRRHPFTLLTS